MHAGEEGGLARFSGTQAQRAADEADLAVTKNGEMLHSFVDSGVVIDYENAAERTRGSGIDEDYWNVVEGEAVEEEVFDAEGHDSHAVYFSFEHAAGTEFHRLGFVVCGTDEDLVSVGDGDLFELLDEFGEERVGNFRDDEAEQFAFAGDEGSGLGVGEIVELGDGLPDAGGEDGIDCGDVVDGAGYGRDGDAGACCYATNVDFCGSGWVRSFVRTFHGSNVTRKYATSILLCAGGWRHESWN